MTWYAIYDKSTGALISISSTIGTLPATQGYVKLSERPDLLTVAWNPTTYTFVPITPPVLPAETSPVLFKSMVSNAGVIVALDIQGDLWQLSAITEVNNKLICEARPIKVKFKRA